MRTASGRPATADHLSPDALHDLLAARRRRYTLYCLYLFANPMRLPDVADRVTEWEDGRPGGTLPDRRLGAYMDLYHSHVPKLVDCDVMRYDQEGDVLELGHNAPQLRPYLEWAAEVDLNGDGPGSL